MRLGDLLRLKIATEVYPTPVLIWQIINQDGENLYIINASEGKTNSELELDLLNTSLFLPNHAKFKFLNLKALEGLYEVDDQSPYLEISEMIKHAYGNMDSINSAYAIIQLGYCLKFKDSTYCNSIIDKIVNDPYSTIKKLIGIEDPFDYQKQTTYNVQSLIKLDFVPKKFAFMKAIMVLKEISAANFRANNDLFSNSIIEALCLGMFLKYYLVNKENIKSITINYSNKFPGEFKVFQQFTSMLDRFQPEINTYDVVKNEEDKIRLMAELTGLNLPEDEYGKGMIMKFLEFDLGFWQRFILFNIIADVPVKKPYKDSYSTSYNYMLLLPFFQWLSPHIFPDYNDKDVKAENYQKIMVERMKSFEEGKI